MCSCSTHSILNFQNKNWTSNPGRSFENKNILMVSSAKDANLERAKFKAEAEALGDLANECSLIVKGTQLEDQAVFKDQNQIQVFVRFAIEKSRCEEAKLSISPQEFARLANFGYIEQVLKYQQEVEKEIAFKAPPPSPYVKIAMILEAAEVTLIHDDREFFMARQQIAYLKQALLLGSKGLISNRQIDFEKVQNGIIKKVKAIQEYEKLNPALMASSATWSIIKDRFYQNSKLNDLNENAVSSRKPAQE